MGIAVVRIDTGNLHLLDELADDVFDNVIDPERLAAYCATPEAVLYVALDDGLVVGQARGYIHRHPDAPDEFYVDNLGVAPSYRRKGIATHLMQALLDAASAHGCVDVWLGTEPDNAEALGFYRSMGLNETPMTLFANYDDND